MNRNHIIIIALIAVILILAVGIFQGLNMHEKQGVKLKIKGDSKFEEGDSVKILLTTLNDTPVANQTVNISITDKDKTVSYYSAVTNEKGIAKMKLDKSEGKYVINCSYAGNENYTANSTVKKIKIKNEVAQSETSSSGSDDYVYSPQDESYVKKSGQWKSDGSGNSIYQYQGDDGVIYERYYDSDGREIDPNEYYG